MDQFSFLASHLWLQAATVDDEAVDLDMLVPSGECAFFDNEHKRPVGGWERTSLNVCMGVLPGGGVLCQFNDHWFAFDPTAILMMGLSESGPGNTTLNLQMPNVILTFAQRDRGRGAGGGRGRAREEFERAMRRLEELRRQDAAPPLHGVVESSPDTDPLHSAYGGHDCDLYRALGLAAEAPRASGPLSAPFEHAEKWRRFAGTVEVLDAAWQGQLACKPGSFLTQMAVLFQASVLSRSRQGGLLEGLKRTREEAEAEVDEVLGALDAPGSGRLRDMGVEDTRAQVRRLDTALVDLEAAFEQELLCEGLPSC